MSTLQKLSLALVGTAVVFMSANPASAVVTAASPVTLTKGGSVLTVDGQETNVQGATTINFNSLGKPIDLTGFATFSGPNQVVNGSVSNQYAAPYNDSGNYLAVETTGSETISFADPISYFGFYWGSVDSYNSVAVYNGSQLLATFTGADVPGATADGTQSGDANNVYVNLLANLGTGETFTSIVLSSTQPAFEVGNFSYKVANVPEPTATLGLLAFGVVSAGSLMKRKSKLA